MSQKDGSEKYYVALSRIYIKSPFIIVENDWHLVFKSHLEAISKLTEISLKQPINISILERTPVRTPRKIYWITKFKGFPEYNITNLNIHGELVEWIGYTDIKSEVFRLVSGLFNTELKNPGIIKSALFNPRIKYDVIKVVYQDEYEIFGEIWLLRRFKQETMEKNQYMFIRGRSSTVNYNPREL